MEKKKKILIVDDEKEIVESLKNLLVPRGFDTVSAFDGKEAIEKVREENPDLIILDVVMPKMDGFKVCSILSEDAKYKDIPVVMLTAKEEVADIQQGMGLGAVSYITKPFKSEALLGIVKGALGEE